MRAISKGFRVAVPASILLAVLAGATAARAQTPATAGAAGANSDPQQSAPIDLTGNWVSLVTEDWRWRMLMPAKGDFQSVPLNQAAYQSALKWDPAKDEAAGQQCKAYGAAALMAMPERLRISWQDSRTLQVRTDAGMQTRVFHFAPWSAAAEAPSWQGQSLAVWENSSGRGGGPSGSLKVVTTNLLPGYLRKNGIPYSDGTRLTEYWDLVSEDSGIPLIVISSDVHDPAYLQEDWITALQFEKEADGSKWDPQPCSARW
jgi:hypothetical protein